MKKRELPNNWLLTGTESGNHMWAAKKNMRVHKSLDRYTAYLVEPFRPMGMFDTAKEAMETLDRKFG